MNHVPTRRVGETPAFAMIAGAEASGRIVSWVQAEANTRALAAGEGIFAGVSSGGNIAAALEVARELERSGTTNAVIVVIICDRGDRYLSTGVFPA